MPTITDKNGTINIVNKHEDHLGTATKVTYTPIKGQKDHFPRGATVVLHGVEVADNKKLGKVFDIVFSEDDGVIQRSIRIMNCSSYGELEDKILATATAQDVSVTPKEE